MKKNKGFTLVELIIVIIIVGILSIVSFTIYRKNVNKAKMAEGKTLLSALIDAEDIRYSNPQLGSYFVTSGSGYVSSVAASATGSIGINAASNKYFRQFKITSGTNSVTIQTKDTQGKITMQVVVSSTTNPVFSILSES